MNIMSEMSSKMLVSNGQSTNNNDKKKCTEDWNSSYKNVDENAGRKY